MPNGRCRLHGAQAPPLLSRVGQTSSHTLAQDMWTAGRFANGGVTQHALIRRCCEQLGDILPINTVLLK